MSNSSMQTQTMLNGVFRLLVPTSQPSPGTRSIELQGRHWLLTEQTLGATDTPEYICVSYAWGRGKTVNPFDESHPMSDRAVPAIEATIRIMKQSQPLHFTIKTLGPFIPQNTLCGFANQRETIHSSIPLLPEVR